MATEVGSCDPVTVCSLTASFKLKFLGVETISPDDATDSEACVGAVRVWNCCRQSNKLRVMLTVSPNGLELAENAEEFWKSKFYHGFEEITHVYHSPFSTRVFAYAVRPRSEEGGKVGSITCIGLKVKRFSADSVGDIHCFYETAFRYYQMSKMESFHKLLSGLVTGLQQVNIGGLQAQAQQLARHTGIRRAANASQHSKTKATATSAVATRKRPNSEEEEAAHVVHCSRVKCSNCTDFWFCRHCPCARCRMVRHRHQCRHRAEVMTETCHEQPSKEDSTTEYRPQVKARCTVTCQGRDDTMSRPASNLGRSARREEIQCMAKQIAVAVLQDRQQRAQTSGSPQTDQRLPRKQGPG